MSQQNTYHNLDHDVQTLNQDVQTLNQDIYILDYDVHIIMIQAFCCSNKMNICTGQLLPVMYHYS